MADAVQVVGLRDLVRAYRVANVAMAKDVRTAIEQAGEPIRQEASEQVRLQVSGMARSRLPWWRMRTGVERNTIGYIVPEQRGARGIHNRRRRGDKFTRVVVPHMHAARDAHIGTVEDEFRQALNDVARAWERV